MGLAPSRASGSSRHEERGGGVRQTHLELRRNDVSYNHETGLEY